MQPCNLVISKRNEDNNNNNNMIHVFDKLYLKRWQTEHEQACNDMDEQLSHTKMALYPLIQAKVKHSQCIY